MDKVLGGEDVSLEELKKELRREVIANEIVPVFGVDKTQVGMGTKGGVTSDIKNLYLQIVRGKVEKYRKWLTPVYES